MINSEWDKLAACLENARINGFSELNWHKFRVTIEYNGGLPILSVTDANSGMSVHDMTAMAVLRVLEGVSK